MQDTIFKNNASYIAYKMVWFKTKMYVELEDIEDFFFSIRSNFISPNEHQKQYFHISPNEHQKQYTNTSFGVHE